MRCLPAHSLIFWIPSSFLCAVVSLLLPLSPSSCHPPSSAATFTWACLVLLPWTILTPCFPQAPRTPGTTPGAVVCLVCGWSPTWFMELPTSLCFACAALINQPCPCMMMPDMKSLECGTCRFSHAIISARSSSLPGTYRPENFPEKLMSSVEQECGKAEIWAARVGVLQQGDMDNAIVKAASACCLSLQVCSWMAPPAAMQPQHADLQVPSSRNARRIEPWNEFMDAWHANGNRRKLSCSRWTEKRRRE